MVEMVVGIEHLRDDLPGGELLQVAEVGGRIDDGGVGVPDQNRVGKKEFAGIFRPDEFNVPDSGAVLCFLWDQGHDFPHLKFSF
jgi:hypothetical protein